MSALASLRASNRLAVSANQNAAPAAAGQLAPSVASASTRETFALREPPLGLPGRQGLWRRSAARRPAGPAGGGAFSVGRVRAAGRRGDCGPCGPPHWCWPGRAQAAAPEPQGPSGRATLGQRPARRWPPLSTSRGCGVEGMEEEGVAGLGGLWAGQQASLEGGEGCDLRLSQCCDLKIEEACPGPWPPCRARRFRVDGARRGGLGCNDGAPCKVQVGRGVGPKNGVANRPINRGGHG